ncbi:MULTISPECIES: prenylated flavin chaperone LpdD [Vibrio]|uniref:Prenylated flavin chaperone LpdD-like domain-containing protein n=2 Tax=Vibrio TaxID=662 RepID=A0A7X4LM28_9VIBR|nr:MULTISPECIES: hypothetical protein [Vibrio]MBF9000952.1 hypothetical protein [Vibrio nitrifigilis]MZI94457.1 hypothetical protein [Vibrio eleionomae]
MSQVLGQSLVEEQDGIRVELTALPVGDDLVLVLSGGDKAHIGATAVAQPRPSLEDPEKISASTSVICVMGHKEDLLAHHVAQKTASALNCVVSANCGIHMDNASKEQIKIIQQLVSTLLQTFIAKCDNQ